MAAAAVGSLRLPAGLSLSHSSVTSRVRGFPASSPSLLGPVMGLSGYSAIIVFIVIKMHLDERSNFKIKNLAFDGIGTSQQTVES